MPTDDYVLKETCKCIFWYVEGKTVLIPVKEVSVPNVYLWLSKTNTSQLAIYINFINGNTISTQMA